MDRRDFLKLASMAGLGVVAGSLPFGHGARAEEVYKGPLWIMVNAGGGWDVTSLCDPKGTTDPEDPLRVNNFLETEIGHAGNISYAPMGINEQFFQKNYQELLVINGVDTSTNSHDVGSRFTWSGSLIENSPAFAALVAGIYAPTKPMAFITNGGYDVTNGVVAVTRVGNIDALNKIAYPDLIDPGDSEASFHSAETTKRIQEARHARHLKVLEGQHLPRLRNSMNALFLARSGQNELKKVTQFLPQDFENAQLRRQTQVAMAAYRAGVCAVANLSIGGFDSHGGNDDQQSNALGELLDGVDFIIEESKKYPETQGNVIVVVGSDFGRTPYYNSDDGKDHWSISSMLLWGKGIKGNRVIGTTDAGHNPNPVDPSTLKESASGVRIKPGHVHRALRKLAGIEKDDIALQFPIAEKEDLPFFS